MVIVQEYKGYMYNILRSAVHTVILNNLFLIVVSAKAFSLGVFPRQ
jgi:hypothetical protein